MDDFLDPLECSESWTWCNPPVFLPQDDYSFTQPFLAPPDSPECQYAYCQPCPNFLPSQAPYSVSAIPNASNLVFYNVAPHPYFDGMAQPAFTPAELDAALINYSNPFSTNLGSVGAYPCSERDYAFPMAISQQLIDESKLRKSSGKAATAGKAKKAERTTKRSDTAHIGKKKRASVTQPQATKSQRKSTPRKSSPFLLLPIDTAMQKSLEVTPTPFERGPTPEPSSSPISLIDRYVEEASCRVDDSQATLDRDNLFANPTLFAEHSDCDSQSTDHDTRRLNESDCTSPPSTSQSSQGSPTLQSRVPITNGSIAQCQTEQLDQTASALAPSDSSSGSDTGFAASAEKQIHYSDEANYTFPYLPTPTKSLSAVSDSDSDSPYSKSLIEDTRNKTQTCRASPMSSPDLQHRRSPFIQELTSSPERTYQTAYTHDHFTTVHQSSPEYHEDQHDLNGLSSRGRTNSRDLKISYLNTSSKRARSPSRTSESSFSFSDDEEDALQAPPRRRPKIHATSYPSAPESEDSLSSPDESDTVKTLTSSVVWEKDNSGRFVCPQRGCKKTFERKFNGSTHYATHFDVRMHSCSACNKTFTRSYDLKRHQKLHKLSSGPGRLSSEPDSEPQAPKKRGRSPESDSEPQQPKKRGRSGTAKA
ncbi:hypothetical protein DFS34DRAFT_86763 [Phlyctochytrium arcticum]|nr:hypothetical protein DFS34DRAFT_86763 [Phlyctochytrium arcticum]